jgi:hypothetical protein
LNARQQTYSRGPAFNARQRSWRAVIQAKGNRFTGGK